MAKSQPEPWLRGTHVEIPPVPRVVIHALELAQEDLATWCGDLTELEVAANPSGLPSVNFQLRHISRSVDRLLTYAEGNQLNARQLEEINTESKVDAASAGLLEEVRKTVAEGSNRIRKLGENSGMLYEPRTVGRKNIPTTVAGLLIHVADHTQRHVGQAITTAKVLRSQRA
jgi:uncharacterized damage-inducible protein DinB